MGDLSIGSAVPVQDTKTTTAPAAGDSQPPANKGKFGRILGSVLGGAVNVMAPAAGSMIGSLIRGGGLGYAAEMEKLIAESAHQQMQLIGVQMRVQERTEQFSTVSNLLKSRHDGEMEAIRNFKT